MAYEKNDTITNIEMFNLCQDYQSINSFILNHNNISYLEFDQYMVEKLTLFVSDPGIDFKLLEARIDRIYHTLSHIKNIFKRPLLHLKEDSMVMPVEVANRIDNDTIIHISTHSELWDRLEEDTLKPSKLLTRIYKDDYSIYENRVFCNIIDYILHFSKSYLRILKDLIFSKKLIELNLLERVNHINYFLALGKLHTGYSRQFDDNTDDVQRCIDKLDIIYGEVFKRLKSPVYKNNQRYRNKVKLHKTNILSMHKDYRKIYSLIKFLRKNEKNVKIVTKDEICQLKVNYFNYVQALTIFSTSHFGFGISGDQRIDFNSLKINSEFKDWKLQINKSKIDNIDLLKLSINKDSKYEIVLIPSLINSKDSDDEILELLNKTKKMIVADEYLICTPFENNLQSSNESFISISSLDSFRRIQQILLRGMICSDMQRVDCSFCKGQLKNNIEQSNEHQTVYSCKNCKTMVVDAKCLENKQGYIYTSIMHFQQHYLWDSDYLTNDEWLVARRIENQMFFRNITKINPQKEIICPHCNKVHHY